MKKIKFILAALMLLACSSTYAIGFDTSVEFAVSQANFKLKDSGLNLENNLGYGVGVSAKINLPILDAGAELWYYRNTASVDGGGEIKSNSLDVPVVVAVSIVGPLAIEAGPSFSIYSSAKYKYEGESTSLGRIRPNIGYVIGARVNILKILTISGRFNGCFSRQKVDFGSNTYEMRYNAWSVGAGVRF